MRDYVTALPKNMSMEDVAKISELLACCTRFMLIITGISNNCALQIVGNSLEKIRKSPLCSKTVKRRFERVRKEISLYEYKLENSPHKFFDVYDFDDQTKQLYRPGLSKSEYFDYWRASGNAGYTLIKNYIYALRHKYYIIERRKRTEEEASVMSDMAIAYTVLTLATAAYKDTVERCVRDTGLPKNRFAVFYKDFSLQPILDCWDKAMRSLGPEIWEDNCDEFDKSNINICANDLLRRWFSTDFIVDSLKKATEEYDDIFRTKGCMKKVLNSIEQIRT